MIVRLRRTFRIGLVGALGAISCTTAWGCAPSESSGEAEQAAEPRQTVRGFVELPALSYTFQVSGAAIPLVAPGARLFYRFVQAREPGAERLCVFLGGGPGLGNERAFLDWGAPAKRSLTELCSVLFLDSRNAGLSYELVSAPLTHVPGVAEYNAPIDALDHARVIAKLASDGTLGNFTDLTFVAESYGGVRATLLLNSLIYGVQHAGAASGLVADALDTDLDSLRVSTQGNPVRYRQVLIQPTLGGVAQDQATGELLKADDSPVWQLAAAEGVELPQCAADCDGFQWMLAAMDNLGKSPYDTRAAGDWLDRELARSRDYASGSDGLLAEVADVVGLRPDARAAAFRVTQAAALPEEAPLLARAGALGVNDRYFVTFNTEAFDGLSSPEAQELRASAFESSYAELFLENTASVPTFITRAQYDLVNYSPALAALLVAQPGVHSVALNEAGAETRPGRWEIVFEDSSRRVLRAPSYAASHSVLDAQAEVLDDLERWLNE